MWSKSGFPTDRIGISPLPFLPQNRCNTKRSHRPSSDGDALGTWGLGDDKESKETTYVFRGFLDEVSIGAEDRRSLFNGPERRAELDDIDRMEAKFEGSDHAEITASSTYGPEEVGVLVGVCGHEAAVRQDHVHREQIIDCQAVAAGQVADAATQSEPGNSGAGDEPAGRSHAEGMGCVIHVAPNAPRFDADGSLPQG